MRFHTHTPFHLIDFGLVIGCGGERSQAPAPQAPAPAAPNDCGVLRDRVTTAFVRLQALSDGDKNAAHYQAVGDVLDKLARDLDRPFTDSSIAALASDSKMRRAPWSRSLNDVSTTSTNVQGAITALGAVKVTTKKLKEHTADVVVSLGEIRDALATGEQIDKDAHAKITAYERAASLLQGLNKRGDQLCPSG